MKKYRIRCTYNNRVWLPNNKHLRKMVYKGCINCTLVGMFTILSLQKSFYLIILSSSNLEKWATKIVTVPAQVQKYIANILQCCDFPITVCHQFAYTYYMYHLLLG